MRGMKIGNEYAQKLSTRYSSTPKAVIAAVAVSLLMKECDNGDYSGVLDAFVKEWAILHINGIVAQKPLITNTRQDPNVKTCRDCGTEESEDQREYDKDCKCGGRFA
jgi:hypothetical protein